MRPFLDGAGKLRGGGRLQNSSSDHQPSYSLLLSDSVDNDNNYNHDDSYKNIIDNNVGDSDINNDNSFRKCSLSYPEPP